MTAGNHNGITSWTAKNITLPSGQCRLSINQYELLPTDNRQQRTGFYLLPQPSRDLRLLHQDVIPL
jgi:hypothetical protein